ncbi:hypothetical protein [Cupriavidus sp. D39]|uniref:hypothetical protein n=1 Tax=Cupriavidus sp. D39 TaxID=2997877 RepID=UPI00226DDAED|nr:hypothetical protein [Cupriavidus sp. D39]MCY0853271.1 hypothetical protein [Cupriavidus sp. D39]
MDAQQAVAERQVARERACGPNSRWRGGGQSVDGEAYNLRYHNSADKAWLFAARGVYAFTKRTIDGARLEALLADEEAIS